MSDEVATNKIGGNESVDMRKLDSLHAASMDYRQLAAMIDAMKKKVAVAKKNVISKLSRRIKTLKGKKNAEESEAVKSKSQRLIDEIAMIKNMEPSRISKFALANEDTVDNLSRKGKVTPHLLSLTRLAEDKALKSYVQKWRTDHQDWKVLANFILSKNTSRHYKRSDQKKKMTEDSLKIERELIHHRLRDKLGEVPKVNVNKPLQERTSKNTKYKKKGKVFDEEEGETIGEEIQAQTSTSAAVAKSAESSSSDSESEGPGVGAGNAEDEDLYTFNIVDDDLPVINNEDDDKQEEEEESTEPPEEGREIKVSKKEKKSAVINPKAKSLANLLFSAKSAEVSESDASEEEDDEEEEEETCVSDRNEHSKLSNKGKQKLKADKKAVSSAKSNSEPKIRPQDKPSKTKKPINNRKPKSKKDSKSQDKTPAATASTYTERTADYNSEDEEGVCEPVLIEEFEIPSATKATKPTKSHKRKVLPAPTITDSKGEMVKAVLDLEELTSQNAETITGDTVLSNEAKKAPRRKKSAFFLGGADEIDESLGTNKEEQDRARRNQKPASAGYKGVTQKQKNWLQSAFTDSLTSSARPASKHKFGKGAPQGNDAEERSQRPSHQSQKFASKQHGDKTNKNKPFEKSGAKKFNKPYSTSVDPPVESLHPSWQASKKRKEQLELIKSGPQGKKIKFDDDD